MIEQQERDQSFSEMCASVKEMRSGQEEILRVIEQMIASQNSLTSMMEEDSTSTDSAEASNTNDVLTKLDGVTKRLMLLEEGVEVLGASLKSSEVVQLDDGSSLKKSDVAAHTLTKRIMAETLALRSEQTRLAAEVRAKAAVNVDDEKLARILMSRLESSFDRKVTGFAERVEKALSAQEARLAFVGEERISKVDAQLDTANRRLERAEKVASELSGALTWKGIGKVALAMLPIALVLLAVAMLLGSVGQLFGIGPVFGWAWGLFSAAETWSEKLIIAALTIGGALGVCWAVVLLGRKLRETYRGW